jgi:hypothetical protein
MTLPIVHAETYKLHNPAFEIWPGGRLTPFFETPQRVEIILEALRATHWANRDAGRGHLRPAALVHDDAYVPIRTASGRSTNPSVPEGYPPTYYPRLARRARAAN